MSIRSIVAENKSIFTELDTCVKAKFNFYQGKTLTAHTKLRSIIVVRVNEIASLRRND